MRRIIRGQEKSFFHITNKQVENLKNKQMRDKYLEVKLLYEHIDTYRHIIDNLLHNK